MTRSPNISKESGQSKIFNLLLRMIDKKKILSKQFTAGKFGYFDSPEPLSFTRRDCTVHQFQINNRNVFQLSPKNKEGNSRHILYLHGGAYIHNFITFHWKFMAEMVKRTGCTITAPDYPLAPDHTYKEAFTMVETIYRQLLTMVEPDNLILMGDSAGGGFALALAQKMRDEHIGQPSQIILLSPLLDITLNNPKIKEIDGLDPLIGIEGLRAVGKIYAGDISPDNYLVSPINGRLKGLGKLTVFAGSNDILAADARKLKSLMEEQGIELDYHEYSGMFHAWMLLNLPESKKAKQQIAELIQLPRLVM